MGELGPRGSTQCPRLEPATLDPLSRSERPLAEQNLKVSGIGRGGPYSLLLRSPKMRFAFAQLAAISMGNVNLTARRRGAAARESRENERGRERTEKIDREQGA